MASQLQRPKWPISTSNKIIPLAQNTSISAKTSPHSLPPLQQPEPKQRQPLPLPQLQQPQQPPSPALAVAPHQQPLNQPQGQRRTP